MPRPDDDVDDLLRAAMKTLDGQVPPGYFEDLPNRTLARLEDSGMDGTSTPIASGTGTSGGVPPVQGQDRDEDSGLHDIRSLASSARMRISSRRISTTPPVDEDVLASSSAGWKAVALPEPAKMVSLPELSELPPAKELKDSRKSRRSIEMPAAAPAPAPVPVAAIAEAPLQLDEPPAAASAGTPLIGARIAAAARPRGKRNLMFGIVGFGLAAAAGTVLYVSTQRGQTPAADTTAATPVAAAQPTPTVQAIAVDEAKPAPAPAPEAAVAEPPAPPADPEPVAADVPDRAPAKAGHSKRAERKPAKTVVQIKSRPEVAASKQPAQEAPKPKPTAAEPDFNELLREAGVDPNKKPDQKPKLERKELGASAFKKGMSAVAGRAKACYNGTQGIAKIALTISPSGHVTKASVSGAFAGTPVAACVVTAVKGATFPPWDGGPQTFHYTYLLAE